MNFNIILAVLEYKGILTEDEAKALVEHLTNATQSSDYRDAQASIKKFLSAPDAQLANLGPVGPEQAAEELRARSLPPIQATDPTPEEPVDSEPVATPEPEVVPTEAKKTEPKKQFAIYLTSQYSLAIRPVKPSRALLVFYLINEKDNYGWYYIY